MHSDKEDGRNAPENSLDMHSLEMRQRIAGLQIHTDVVKMSKKGQSSRRGSRDTESVGGDPPNEGGRCLYRCL